MDATVIEYPPISTYYERSGASLACRAVVFAVFLLSLMDVFLTLHGTNLGVFFEMNPLLRTTLEADVSWFLGVKMGLTAFWAWMTLRFERVQWFRLTNLGVLFAYTLVVGRSVLFLGTGIN